MRTVFATSVCVDHLTDDVQAHKIELASRNANSTVCEDWIGCAAKHLKIKATARFNDSRRARRREALDD